MENIEKFKFKKNIQMRWNDLDALGHVNNAIFVTYFETGRGHYMLEACPGWDWTKHMFLIGNVQVTYYKELLLSAENPQVWMCTSKIGTKSFTLDYVVVSTKKGETVVHASGSTTQVMFDMKKKVTVPIDDWIKTNLTAFEK